MRSISYRWELVSLILKLSDDIVFIVYYLCVLLRVYCSTTRTLLRNFGCHEQHDDYGNLQFDDICICPLQIERFCFLTNGDEIVPKLHDHRLALEQEVM